MQVVLALDTSTDACSVALDHDGRVHFRHHLEARAHNRVLLPMIEDVLTEAGLAPGDLDGVAFGRGPGSFTGLRIAAAVTQGLAWAHELQVLGVSSLEVLAAEALRRVPAAMGVITLLDARMGECYWNTFAVAASGLEPCGEDGLDTPAAISAALQARCAGKPGVWLLVGAELLPKSLWPAWQGCDVMALAEVMPDARTLLALAAPRLRAGEGRAAATAVPAYLRDASRWRRLDDPPPQRPTGE
ncbi:MAG: tRNA (adenosine(37)-N6)-threonylcarbamoyltransferase complex dimerization subunit type 1 TsaB [Gammaproteobacteria bacterium]|nr:tRNA (adenosine(37)-N6)-threonylcarbamoyltransferase complex dimerization subunit type 1 TsaB [Gammaproteobacteria bacterium]